jgi:hypothetical protein
MCTAIGNGNSHTGIDEQPNRDCSRMTLVLFPRRAPGELSGTEQRIVARSAPESY